MNDSFKKIINQTVFEKFKMSKNCRLLYQSDHIYKNGSFNSLLKNQKRTKERFFI
jgi:hypothetical protein